MSENTETKGGRNYWLKEIGDAEKREKNFRKEGKEIIDIFDNDDKAANPYNILFSNTDTLLPALYNVTPRPVIQRRFKDENTLTKDVSELTRRSLEYYMDPGNIQENSFDSVIENAILMALLPGRGLTRFSFEATFGERQERAEAQVEGEEPSYTKIKVLESEELNWESVPWNKFLMGFAKSWKAVPWIAFEHDMTKMELEETFGEELAAKFTMISSSTENEDSEKKETPPDSQGVSFARVYEIWVKESHKVLFVSENFAEEIVKSVDDPLELKGFYPIPRPLVFKPRVGSLLPTPLYRMYENQAKELNAITIRIDRIIKALKVRGFYDGTIQDIEKLMDSDDNVLLPAANVAALQQGTTFERAIWFMPIEKLVGVLQQLYVQRQQVKAVIFEITGIADIMRGSTKASETLGAQELKTQWGSIRLKRMQKMVQIYVRDCLRLMSNICMKQFTRTKLAEITGKNFPTAEEKMRLRASLMRIQQQIQANPQAAQDPNIAMQVQQLQAAASQSSWDELESVYQNDLMNSYKIDIETNSTVDTEFLDEKKELGELLGGMGQFFTSITPLMQTGMLPFPAFKAMMLDVVRKYRFGVEVEDEFKKLQQPPPPPAQAAEGKAKEAESMSAAKVAEINAKVAEQEGMAKLREIERNEQLAVAEFQNKAQDIARKSALAEAKHRQQIQALLQKAAATAVKESTDAPV